MINNALRAIQGSARQNKIFWITKKWLSNDWQAESQIVQTVQQETGSFGGVYIVADGVFPAVTALEVHDALVALCDRGMAGRFYVGNEKAVFWKQAD